MKRHTMFLDWKNTVKMIILPKAIYRFNEILIKLPMAFFYRTRTNFKCAWKCKRSQIAKATETPKMVD